METSTDEATLLIPIVLYFSGPSIRSAVLSGMAFVTTLIRKKLCVSTLF